MRTTLDLTTILYGRVNVPEITALIDGAIYKDIRPVNSDRRDIVCASTTVDGEGIQQGVGYVNIHIPGPVPEHGRFAGIAKAVIDRVEGYALNDYSLLIANVMGPMEQEGENNGWYMSIRVRIRMYRVN